jgi:CRISPR system Cascade subunit CasE
MYLSRIALSTATSFGRRLVSDTYLLHQCIEAALPDDPRPLWRVEAQDDSANLIILAQSQFEPAWTKAFYAPTLASAELRRMPLSYETGEQLAFRLLANPTKRDGDPQEKGVHAKVVGIQEPEAQVAWLTRKLEGAAQLRNVYLRQGLPVKAKKRGAATHSCHLAVLFEGDLVVEDAGKLRELVTAGIGRAKGYGFGLLSLA